MSSLASPVRADRLVILGSKGGPAIRPGGPLPTGSSTDIGFGVGDLIPDHLIPADLPGFEREEWLEATQGFQGETIVSHDGLAITRS